MEEVGENTKSGPDIGVAGWFVTQNDGGTLGDGASDGDALLLPAVTFATLPRLTAASAGPVPNPYR